MQITADYGSGRLIIHLAGELDHHGAREGMEAIERLLDEYMPRDAVLDMAGSRGGKQGGGGGLEA